MSNFIQDCIDGNALIYEVDDYIDEWHDSDSDLSLSEFLGMTEKEYALFVEDESYIATIVTVHKTNENIVTVMREHLAMAARSNDAATASKIQKWLENENLWD